MSASIGGWTPSVKHTDRVVPTTAGSNPFKLAVTFVPPVSAMGRSATLPVAAEPMNGSRMPSLASPGVRAAVKITAPAWAVPGRYGVTQLVSVTVTLPHGPDRSGRSLEKAQLGP